ncbi:MAG: hypothetical protein GF383_14460 [Candidatus Lokiarchaeota archaeon]|nr:hypothetical protein [Candidatus Lokiarchaeota archaeon]MBD3342596.1 hypothetical protein [Candidatus Lokiarchaeota archaeon]
MNYFHKSHGKHCYLRSFQTMCPKCGKDVLYWECTHGCKVFFEYPPYGKLIKHKCKKYKSRNQKKLYPIIVKKPKGLLEKASPSCPNCGKLFKREKDLKKHLNESNKRQYIQETSNTLFVQENSRNQLKSGEKMRIHYKPEFGKINIKRRDK